MRGPVQDLGELVAALKKADDLLHPLGASILVNVHVMISVRSAANAVESEAILQDCLKGIKVLGRG